MLLNLKLSHLAWISATIGLAAILIVFTSSSFMHKDVDKINQAWKLHQTDLSFKSQLENAIRSSLGYGGMIHNFKNYLLRHNDAYHSQAVAQNNDSITFLKLYKKLDINDSEAIAIEDILSVLTIYKKNLKQAKLMVEKNKSMQEIYHATLVDDKPAIRGFNTLRNQLDFIKIINEKPNKSRLLTDIRAAIGYNGMIHKFKDYVLNQHGVIPSTAHKEHNNKEIHSEIIAHIEVALTRIKQYKKQPLTDAEIAALNDIGSTIQQYKDKIRSVKNLQDKRAGIQKIDQQVRINDYKAIRGLQLLEKQINTDLTGYSNTIDNTFNQIIFNMKKIMWIDIATLFFIILFSLFLMQIYVIRPLIKVTNNITRLAKNELGFEITDIHTTNEFGKIVNALIVFKKNLIKLKESENKISQTNEALLHKLEENKILRAQSDEQAKKAILMADNMNEARIVAEKATIKAKTERLFVSSVLNAVRDAIITINAKGLIEIINPGAEDMFGYKSYELVGKNVSILMPEPTRSAHDAYIEHFLAGESTRDQSKAFQQIALRKNGEKFAVEVSLNTIEVNGEIKVTGVIRDITERLEKEKEIHKLAMTDSLTGLANRNQFEKRLHEMQSRAKRFNHIFCLMSIDLDKFKPVNDTYGHHIGDKLLQKVAQILIDNCRETDAIARLGGDEFSIILDVIDTPKELSTLAERLVLELSKPFEIEEHLIQIGASIGISCYPNDTNKLDTLQIMADQALYSAKEAGRNTYKFYQENN